MKNGEILEILVYEINVSLKEIGYYRVVLRSNPSVITFGSFLIKIKVQSIVCLFC